MSAGARAMGRNALLVDPQPKFDLSPYLFMQFMEALGTTDPSVEAGWDFSRSCWREDLIKVTRELAPTLIRWPGGTLTAYYRWKEAIGPPKRRKPLMNLCWEGVETNQVGTHEFIDFCRQVKADPLMVVNFESEGSARWTRDPAGSLRQAGLREAAEWVDYCNNPKSTLRKKNGAPQPFDVRLWQIGNETSYDKHGFDCETTAKRTVAFAKAMRKADPTIRLIGWGDSGWAPRMLQVAGEHIEYIAFHYHFDSGLPNSPLKPNEYRKDPDRTWHHLMNACKSLAQRLGELRQEVSGHDVGLAMTEGHFALPGHNRGSVLATWAAGVACARLLNVQVRNGDILKIATLADFCGSLWTVNAVMIPTPRERVGEVYMMPVARIMSLYRKHMGKKAVDVKAAPDGLDVTASRSGKRIYLYVVNTNRLRAVRARLAVKGLPITSGQVFEIAEDPMLEMDSTIPGAFAPKKHALPNNATWDFAPASVTAVELPVEESKR
ncbi:MAG: alpha-L-arabinofuranosidase [Phycisphaerae bacterium]